MHDQSGLMLHEAQTMAHNEARAESRKLIEAAMGLIKLRHDVDEESAFAILVQRSVDGRRSVRATAIGTLTDLPD